MNFSRQFVTFIKTPRHLKKSFLLLVMLAPQGALAGNWGVGIGHNNPPGASIGGNFTYFWSNTALELGVGQAATASDKSNKSASLSGDLDVKFFFGSTWRPYLELGVGVGLSLGTGSGLDFGGGSPFGGGGVMYMGSKWYTYLGADCGLQSVCNKVVWPVFGVGFKI